MARPAHTIERVARDSYGKLLAMLAVRSRDLAACEDALAEAFAAALGDWPQHGLPERPEAWLLTVARNRLTDASRRQAIRDKTVQTLFLLETERLEQAAESDRLTLLFVCAHPAIDVRDRTPLMLQVVLGLDAETIGRAFLRSKEAMAKRLVRAKAKIKRAGIPFELPERAQWAARLQAVLEAIYGAYGQRFDYAGGSSALDVREDALQLARLVAQALPREPEAQALYALLSIFEARAAAGLDKGRFVPLDEQDTSAWDRPMLDEANARLRRAAADEPAGRFVLEASIASCHAERLLGRGATWEMLVRLYDLLHARFPTAGAWLGLCVARMNAFGAQDVRSQILAAEGSPLVDQQPYWAVRAEVFRRLGEPEEAAASYERALALTHDQAVRAWLEEVRSALASRSVLERVDRK